MSISSKGLSLIKHFEGLRLDAYQCSAGRWTIGYGTTVYPDTGKKVKRGDTCTPEQAEQWLLAYIAKDNDRLEVFMKQHRIKLNMHEKDAILSFAYNLGLPRVINGKSSISKALISKNKNRIVDAIKLYCKVRVGRWPFRRYKTLQGLKRRRDAEAKLFLSI